MKKFFITILLVGLSVTAFSQNISKNQKIRDLLELTGAGKLGEQIAKKMLASFKDSYSNVDPQFWDEFSNQIKSEDLVNLIVPIYDKYYTEDDIDQLISFYKTPIGKKVIETLPAISQESMQAGQTWGRELAQKVMRQLKEKGYIKN